MFLRRRRSFDGTFDGALMDIDGAAMGPREMPRRPRETEGEHQVDRFHTPHEGLPGFLPREITEGRTVVSCCSTVSSKTLKHR